MEAPRLLQRPAAGYCSNRSELLEGLHCPAAVSDGSRKLTAICELAGFGPDGALRLRRLFEFVRTGTAPGGRVIGTFEATGYLPSFVPELLVLGLVERGEPFV